MRGPFGVSLKNAEAGFSVLESTNDSRVLVGLVKHLLQKIYEPGRRYKKAGVMALDLCLENNVQKSLLYKTKLEHVKIMQVMDKINAKYGRDTIKLAATGGFLGVSEWIMKQQKRSPNYTTDFSDLKTIQI